MQTGTDHESDTILASGSDQLAAPRSHPPKKTPTYRASRCGAGARGCLNPRRRPTAAGRCGPHRDKLATKSPSRSWKPSNRGARKITGPTETPSTGQPHRTKNIRGRFSRI